jgi:hypothetical protein
MTDVIASAVAEIDPRSDQMTYVGVVRASVVCAGGRRARSAWKVRLRAVPHQDACVVISGSSFVPGHVGLRYMTHGSDRTLKAAAQLPGKLL